MLDCKPSQTPMVAGTELYIRNNESYSNPTYYRSVIGALQYLTMIKSDLSFIVNKLSQFSKKPFEL